MTGLVLIIFVGLIWLVLQPRDPQIADLTELEAQINQVESPQMLVDEASEPAEMPDVRLP